MSQQEAKNYLKRKKCVLFGMTSRQSGTKFAVKDM